MGKYLGYYYNSNNWEQMSLIKDKSLKKINCDKRVTIDSIHNAKIKSIKNDNNKRNTIIISFTIFRNNIERFITLYRCVYSNINNRNANQQNMM